MIFQIFKESVYLAGIFVLRKWFQNRITQRLKWSTFKLRFLLCGCNCVVFINFHAASVYYTFFRLIYISLFAKTIKKLFVIKNLKFLFFHHTTKTDEKTLSYSKQQMLK